MRPSSTAGSRNAARINGANRAGSLEQAVYFRNSRSYQQLSHHGQDSRQQNVNNRIFGNSCGVLAIVILFIEELTFRTLSSEPLAEGCFDEPRRGC